MFKTVWSSSEDRPFPGGAERFSRAFPALGSKLTILLRYLNTYFEYAHSLPLSPHSSLVTHCVTEGIAVSRSWAERALIDFMSDHPGQNINEAIEQKRARLAEQAAAIEREMAELADLSALAAKHNMIVSPAPIVSKEGDAVQTVAELAESYRADPRSPYHSLRFKVRQNYDSGINRIVAAAGPSRIADLNAPAIKRLYDQWASDGKLASGRALIAKLRLLSSFGFTVLNSDACMRLSTVLRNMHFPLAKARAERLTADQAIAIRAKAHEMGRSSIALAQAFQFDLPLKQTDVIGEWVPLSEHGVGVSDIVHKKMGKWVRGLRWEEIDEKLILHHVTSMHQRELEVDLKRAPMVMEELRKIGKLPKRGPVIVCEFAGKPWSQNEYRRWWRKLADAVGVPKNVKNMDSSRADGSNENRSLAAPVAL
jgi:hypothetical protein